MKTLQINTTQNVNIDFVLATEVQRMGAFVIDNIIKIAYYYFVYYHLILKNINMTYYDSWSVMSIYLLGLSPIIFYSLYSEILMNGQTLGKRVLHIRVVNIDGYKPSIADYLIRWFLRIVDFNLFYILVVYAQVFGLGNNDIFLLILFFLGKFIGIVAVASSKKNQRIGDMSANTVVINTKDNAKFSQTILEEISEDYQPKYASVIKLSDNDMRIIKDTFTVARNKKDYQTLIKLRNKIEEVIQVKGEEENDIDFIDRVLKDYNYYTQTM